MPEKSSILEFKNFKHSMHVPIVVYADFECLTKPIESCKPNLDHSYTEQYQKHEPSGFCFNIVCDDTKWRISVLSNQHALTASSFPQSMVARLVLNLLKSRDTIAVLKRSTAFDAFPLWHTRIFLNVW